MLARCSRLPNDLEPHLTLCPFLVENNFAYGKTQDALSISRRPARSPVLPKSGCASCSNPRFGPERTSTWIKPKGQCHTISTDEPGRLAIAAFRILSDAQRISDRQPLEHQRSRVSINRFAFRLVADLLNQPAKEKRCCIRLFLRATATHLFGKEIDSDLPDNCGLASDRYPRNSSSTAGGMTD